MMNNKFYKIIKLLVKDENITEKILKVLHKFNKKFQDEELNLCLVKMLIIFIYNNTDNSLIFINVVSYFTNTLNKTLRNKILKIFKNINLSKQFLISDYIMDQIVKNTFYILQNTTDESFKLWLNTLEFTLNSKLKTVYVKSLLYNVMLIEIKNNREDFQYHGNLFKIISVYINEYLK